MQTKSDRLREAARKLGTFNLDELFNTAEFGRPTRRERERLRTLLYKIKNCGGLERLGFGVYRYTHKEIIKPPKPRANPLQVKMWRAMRNLNKRNSFTRMDVAQLSGAANSYVNSYIKFLLREWYLEQVGRIRHPSGFNYLPTYKILSDKDVPETPYFNTAKGACKLNKDTLYALKIKTMDLLEQMRKPAVLTTADGIGQIKSVLVEMLEHLEKLEKGAR